MKKIDRNGEIGKNTFGTIMKIIEFENYDNIIVEFQDEYKYKIKSNYRVFKKGTIKNPYDKEVFSVGYIGVGKYKSSKNKKDTKEYKVWSSMIQRCYDPYFLNKEPTYIDCYVCKEWLNFQNFAKWWEENVYNCNNEKMCLDKDILIKGNKVYSPETCMIVPQRINNLFINRNRDRGDLPIGCSYLRGKIQVRCNIIGKNEYLGVFPLDKPFQAFTAYKNFKENHIKQVADEYKDLITQKLYKAMYDFKVEIND